MITIMETKGYIYNIRVQKLLKILNKIEIIHLYNCDGKNIFFKIYRKILRILGIYKKINMLILRRKLKKHAIKPTFLSFSYDFCDIFDGNILLDIDDPYFDKHEIDLINSDKILALIVTTSKLKEIYKKKYKINKPIYVIPTPINIQKKKSINKEGKNFIVGYYSAFISDIELSSLLKIIDSCKTIIEIEFWVIGKTNRKILRPNIKYFGYLEHDKMMKKVKKFDAGLYIRENDLQGRLSIKIIELMSLGIPIVSTNVSEAFCIKEANAGIITSIENIPDGIEKIYKDKKLYRKLSINCKKYVLRYSNKNVKEKYLKLIKKYK